MASSLAQLLAQGGLDPGAYGGLQNVELGNALLQQGLDSSPTTGWGALGRLASTLAGSHLSSTGQTSLRDAVTAGRKSASSDLLAALTPQAKASTATPALTAPQSTEAAPDKGGSYGKAISGIESGGRYDLLGPVTKTGDRAYGKYQVMGANIPEWTQAALGKSMTPQEFLADEKAQDAVFNQRFGQYVDKYGPEGAAKAWFAGEKGMKNPNARDQLGTTVQSYADKFRTALGVPPAVQAIDAVASGQPTPTVTPAEPKVTSPTAAQPIIDVQRLMAVMQNPYADDATKQIAGKLLLQAISPKEDEFASGPLGIYNKRTGEIKQPAPKETNKQVVTLKDPNTGAEMSAVFSPDTGKYEPVTPPATAGAPATVTGPGGKQIEIPPGVNPKKFRDDITAQTANAAAGKFTEEQGKALQFAKRMEHAEGNLGPLEAQGTSAKGSVLNSTPGGNYLQSNDYQKYRQAQQEFITALLRRESGAAIAQHEFDQYGRQFFPQPGDSKDVIDQKREARKTALEAMRVEAGPAYQPPKESENTKAAPPDRAAIEAEMKRRGLLK